MAKLIFFGRLADITGQTEQVLDLPANIATTADLRAWLDQGHACDGVLLETSIRLAINNDIVHEPADVDNHDEIAFMPPVGGG